MFIVTVRLRGDQAPEERHVYSNGAIEGRSSSRGAACFSVAEAGRYPAANRIMPLLRSLAELWGRASYRHGAPLELSSVATSKGRKGNRSK